MDDDRRRRVVADQLRFQALAEPFYGALLEHLADDIVEGGPSWRPLSIIADLPDTENLSLRLMGAAHRVALAGSAPDYAAHLPSCGGDGDAEAAWPALRALCVKGALDEGVLQPVQTNEPTRAAALVPGFGQIATETGLPLRLLELGLVGRPGAALRPLLPRDRRGHVGRSGVARAPAVRRHRPPGAVPGGQRAAGCDPRPLDPAADRLVLLSFVWPTRVERFRAVEAALALAAETPVAVDRAGAAAWLAEQLAEPVEGVATVIFHSVVWQYLDPVEQRTAAATIHEAGRQGHRLLLRWPGCASSPTGASRWEPSCASRCGPAVRTAPSGSAATTASGSAGGRPPTDPRRALPARTARQGPASGLARDWLNPIWVIGDGSRGSSSGR